MRESRRNRRLLAAIDIAELRISAARWEADRVAKTASAWRIAAWVNGIGLIALSVYTLAT